MLLLTLWDPGCRSLRPHKVMKPGRHLLFGSCKRRKLRKGVLSRNWRLPTRAPVCPGVRGSSAPGTRLVVRLRAGSATAPLCNRERHTIETDEPVAQSARFLSLVSGEAQRSVVRWYPHHPRARLCTAQPGFVESPKLVTFNGLIHAANLGFVGRPRERVD